MRIGLRLLAFGILSVCIGSPDVLASACREVFAKPSSTSESPLRKIIERGDDFVMTDFVSGSAYAATGCGVACAINLLQSVTHSLGLPPKTSRQHFADLRPFTDPFFTTSLFGTHVARSLVGLNVGSLSRVLESTLQRSLPVDNYSVQAYQKAPHAQALSQEKGIQFLADIQRSDPFSVHSHLSKILLVEISRSRGLAKDYLTTHFYSVVGFRDGILALHDPLSRGQIWQFEVRSYFADGFPTFQLIPLSRDYSMLQQSGLDLHLMVNGFVIVETRP